MAHFSKEDTTFGLTVDDDVMIVDMAEVAELAFGGGANYNFVIDRNNLKAEKQPDGTYKIVVPCESVRTFNAYDGYYIYRKFDAELKVLEDGTVISATLANVKETSDVSDLMNSVPDIHYGIKPDFISKIIKNPYKALFVNLNKAKDNNQLELLVKAIDHALDNSTIPYKKALAIKSKVHEKANKILGKGQEGTSIEA